MASAARVQAAARGRAERAAVRDLSRRYAEANGNDAPRRRGRAACDRRRRPSQALPLRRAVPERAARALGYRHRMIVPQYWAEARRRHRDIKRQITVRRFGWSDVSE